MRQIRIGPRRMPPDARPDSPAGLVSEAPSGTGRDPHGLAGAGWMVGPLRDIGLALLAALIVVLAVGRILQAW